MKIAEKIGLYKKQNEITIFQRKRWNDIFKSALDRKKDLGLSEEPKYLPPQIQDPSGLSSWMAAFLYLQHFDFKEIKNNFSI